MMHLIGDIAKYFKFDEVNIDNWVFKLFYKGCFILFLMGSMVGILSQYFGEPINCDFKGIDAEMASDYCWIHGSNHFEKRYQPHMKCIVDHDGAESELDVADTSYYQWVTFVLMFQAATFILPYKLWQCMEGGLLAEFGLDANARILLENRDDIGDGHVMEPLVEKYVKFFRSILHRNNYYFAKFVCCEGLNLVMLYANFYLTDVFINGNFWYYGYEVFQFSKLSRAEQIGRVNPMCKAFPTEVSCELPNVGAAGGEQNHNGICVLSQNILNEKMYLAMWFWLVFVIIISPLCIIYRIMVLFFDGFRTGLLITRIGNTNDKFTRKAIKVVMAKCYIGDWFVLYQLSKNVNMYFFRAFMRELKHELTPASRKGSFIVKNKTDTLSRSQTPFISPKIDENEDSDVEGKSNSPSAPIICCCATNVKAAFVLGISLAVLSFLGCFKGTLGTMINGILSGLIHCILILGTHTRNSLAILVWMVWAIFSCIGNAIIAVMAIIVFAQTGEDAGAGAIAVSVGTILFFIGMIVFEIWTIIVAKNARKEIEDEEDA